MTERTILLIQSQPLLAIAFWDIAIFAVITIIIVGFQYGKVMFDRSYSVRRMLIDLGVLALIAVTVLIVSALI